jgi:hypothetical protein
VSRGHRLGRAIRRGGAVTALGKSGACWAQATWLLGCWRVSFFKHSTYTYVVLTLSERLVRTAKPRPRHALAVWALFAISGPAVLLEWPGPQKSAQTSKCCRSVSFGLLASCPGGIGAHSTHLWGSRTQAKHWPPWRRWYVSRGHRLGNAIRRGARHSPPEIRRVLGPSNLASGMLAR